MSSLMSPPYHPWCHPYITPIAPISPTFLLFHQLHWTSFWAQYFYCFGDLGIVTFGCGVWGVYQVGNYNVGFSTPVGLERYYTQMCLFSFNQWLPPHTEPVCRLWESLWEPINISICYCTQQSASVNKAKTTELNKKLMRCTIQVIKTRLKTVQRCASKTFFFRMTLVFI